MTALWYLSVGFGNRGLVAEQEEVRRQLAELIGDTPQLLWVPEEGNYSQRSTTFNIYAFSAVTTGRLEEGESGSEGPKQPKKTAALRRPARRRWHSTDWPTAYEGLDGHWRRTHDLEVESGGRRSDDRLDNAGAGEVRFGAREAGPGGKVAKNHRGEAGS